MSAFIVRIALNTPVIVTAQVPPAQNLLDTE